MNRAFLKIALIAALLLSLLIFPSCDKEEEPTVQPAETQTFPIRAEFAGEDGETLCRIQALGSLSDSGLDKLAQPERTCHRDG